MKVIPRKRMGSSSHWLDKAEESKWFWINYFIPMDRAVKELREKGWSWEQGREEGQSLSSEHDALSTKKVLFIRHTSSFRTQRIWKEDWNKRKKTNQYMWVLIKPLLVHRGSRTKPHGGIDPWM